jgi:RNase P subunit RPR2
MSFAADLPKGMDEMKTSKQHVCPRCEYPLVPVHAVEGSRRRVIALTCPEPYCDHMQMLPSDLATQLARETTTDLRAAN